MLILGLAFTAIKSAIRNKSLGPGYTIVQLYNWSRRYDWLADTRQLCILTVCMDLVTIGVTISRLIFVKQWIGFAFQGDRKWRCSVDGYFLIYLLFLLGLAATHIDTVIFVCSADEDEFTKKQKDWYWFTDDGFYHGFEAVMIHSVFNFAMTLFAIYMLEKMSLATWSARYKDDDVTE